MIKAKRQHLLLVAALTIGACSSGGSGGDSDQNAITNSLINGYHLTQIVVRDGQDELIGNSIITYDSISNTDEWVSYDELGGVNFRDVGYFNDEGRLIRSEDYDELGALLETDDYTIEGGLITQRSSSDGRLLKLSYTDDNVLVSREHSDQSSGLVSRFIEFTADANGRIISANDTFYDYDGATLTATTPGSRTFGYNNQGQLVLVTFFDEFGNNTGTSELSYDGNGNNIERISKDAFGDVEARNIYSFEQSTRPVINYRLRIYRFFL